MQITLAALADAANRSDNGKLNLLGVFQSLYAPSVPCQHPQMALVLSFECTAMERGTRPKVGIRLVNSDAKVVLSIPEQILDVPNDPSNLTPNLNLIVNLNGITFESFGSHQFEVYIEGVLCARLPLHVNPPPQPPGTWTGKMPG
ncbi:MAG: DUF6941 family protein [Capsulimonadaceae bacterium]